MPSLPSPFPLGPLFFCLLSLSLLSGFYLRFVQGRTVDASRAKAVATSERGLEAAAQRRHEAGAAARPNKGPKPKARPPPPPPGASSSVLPVGVTATATVARGFAAQHSLAIVGGGHRQVTARGYHPSILAAVAAIAASQGAIVAQQARRAEVEFLNAEQAAGGGDQEAVHAEYEPPEPLGELPYQEADDP